MRKLHVTLIVGLMLALLAGTQASAAILQIGDNTINFTSWETAVNADGNPAIIGPGGNFGVGSVLYGVLSVNVITHADGSTWLPGGSNGFITGVFMSQVTNVTLNGLGQQVFTLGAVTSSLSAVPTSITSVMVPNEVFKLYTNTIDLGQGLNTYGSAIANLTPAIAAANRAQSITNAEAGSTWLGLSQTGASDFFDTTITNPFIDTTIKNDTFGKLNFGMSVIENNTGFLFESNPQVTGVAALEIERSTQQGINTPSSLGYHYTFPVATAWDIRNVDPANATATPEPATLLIMGSGLMGLFGLRRRQKNA